MDQYLEVLRALAAYDPPREHTNFCVTYRMSTPISLAHPWINGDGLIAQVLMRRLLGDTLLSLPSKKPIDISCLKLPLARTGSVWHCSVSQFDTDQKFVTKIYGRFDADDIGHVKTKKKRIPLMAGHFKSSMVSIPTSLAKEVRFYVRGNIDECKWLFANVTALGKDRNKGYGAVQSMSIEEIPEDWSLFRDGVVMRPIPVREMPVGWMQSGMQAAVMNLTFAPPYWNRAAAVQCVAPGSRLAGFPAGQCWDAVEELCGESGSSPLTQ
jgi:CRISPR type IV-associated protein Csf3